MSKLRPHCRHCGGLLSNKPAHISEGYQFACLHCDEDFCNFEAVFKPAAKGMRLAWFAALAAFMAAYYLAMAAIYGLGYSINL